MVLTGTENVLNSTDSEQYFLKSSNVSLLNDIEILMLNSMKNKEPFSQFSTCASFSFTDNNPDLANFPNMRDHVMINNFEGEMGTHWGIAALHKYSTPINQSIADSSWSFLVGDLSNNAVKKQVLLDDESAAYYDANIKFVYSDTMAGIARSGNDASGNVRTPAGNRLITFDLSGNYNAFKAANSMLSRVDACGATIDHGMRYADYYDFNTTSALLSNKQVNRNANGSLYQVDPSYQSSNNLNISVVSALNANVKFGILKLVQPEIVIDVSYDPNVSVMTMMDASNIVQDPSNNLPTSLTRAQFNSLFTSAELAKVGPGYTLNITADDASSGSYTLETTFRGFDLSDNYIKRNMTYMSTLTPFSDVSHSIEITNGDFVVDPSGSYNSTNLALFSIEDGDETLDADQYNTNGSITFNVKDRETRAELVAPFNDTSLSTLRITYPGDPSTYSHLAGDISDNRLTTYDLCYNWTCLVPSTDVCSNYLSSSMISKRDNAVAVICTSSASLFGRGDVTFDMCNNLLPNNDRLNLIHVQQNFQMADEDGSEFYYYDASNFPTTYTINEEKATIDVAAINVNLNRINCSDVRVAIQPKIVTNLTNGWTYDTLDTPAPSFVLDPSNGNPTLLTGKNTFGCISSSLNMSHYFDSKHNIDAILDLTFDRYARSSEELNIKASITVCDASDNTISDTISYKLDDKLPTFQMIEISRNSLSPQSFSNLPGLPQNSVLMVKVTRTEAIFKVRFPLSAYSNLFIETKKINLYTVEFYLQNSQTGKRLPDSKMVAVAPLLSSRSISLNIPGIADAVTITSFTTRLLATYSPYSSVAQFIADFHSNAPTTIITHVNNMRNCDLYTCYGYLEIKNNSGIWVKQLNSETDVDLCFDVGSTMDYMYDENLPSASFIVNIDLPDQAVIGEQSAYFVELSDKPGASTFSILGYDYTLEQVSLFEGTTWDPMSDDATIFFPNEVVDETLTYSGNSLNLSTLIVRSDPSLSDPSDQNRITLQIINNNIEGPDNVIATFVSSINIAANFNIIYNPTPILKVVEGLETDTNTYYVSEQTEQSSAYRYIKVIEGVEVGLKPDIVNDSKEYFVVPGDQIQCDLYDGYFGNYSGELTEITPIDGLDVGDENCRHLTLNQYRGVVATETVQLNRSVTTIQFKIVKGTDEYTNDLGDLYFGSSHVVDDISVLGDLGLQITGNNSMFSTDTSMSRQIDVTHGSYNVSISNPLDLSMNETYTVSTKDYNIKSYQTMGIVASRVKVYQDEMYKISYSVPNVQVYLNQMDCAGVNPTTYTQWTLLETHSDSSLRTGLKINTNSQLSVKRTSINVQPFTEWYSLPRPQFKLEAISTNSVTNVPYLAGNVSRQVYYCDISYGSVHNPFSGRNGMNNVSLTYAAVGGGIVPEASESYTKKRLNGSSAYDYFLLKSNTIDMHLNYGKNSIGTNANYPIYLGEVDRMPLTSTSEFSAVYDGSYGSSDFKYRQPLYDLLPASFANTLTDKNILVNDVHNFGTGEGYINMYTGDSIMFNLYGLRYELSEDGQNYQCTFVKYATDYGMDYFNENLVFDASHSMLDPSQNLLGFQYGQTIKNVKFYATSRYTCGLTIPINDNVLTDVPYNFTTINNSISLEELNWVIDEEFESKNLQINVVSLSTHGLNFIQQWLAVNKFTPISILCLQTPDLMSYKSLDGSSIFRISYCGNVITPSVRTFEVALVGSYDPSYPYNLSSTVSAEEKIATELFAYNVTNI